MTIEARITISLPDIKHTDEDITKFVKARFGHAKLDKNDLFYAKIDKTLAIGWEYDDVDANLIERK